VPKVGMQPLRKQQLINATLESVAQYGLQKTTIMTISKIAGLSSGIISHYFGGKQGLIEATVKFLLEQLKLALLERVSGQSLTAPERLKMIVEPSSSITLGAVLKNKDKFNGKKVGLIISGGNVDLDHLPW